MVFKTLIGVIVVIAAITLSAELLNVTTSSHMVTQMIDKSMELACDYFSQETYKTEGSGARGNMPNITGTGKDKNGVSGGTVSGLFYNGSSAESIYNNLYSKPSFSTFVSQFSGTWSSLANIQNGDSDLMNDNLITPSNMGVTYLDKEVITRVAKWNIAKILSGGISDNIKGSGDGTYVTYNGFNVYVNKLEITSLQYKEVNVFSSEFTKYTNMVGSRLGVDASDVERSNICVATIEFSVPIDYVGITKFKELIEFGSNSSNRVEGIDGVAGNAAYEASFSEYASGKYESGGNGSNITPRNGVITYYIIR